MPACEISYMKYLFVLVQLGAVTSVWISKKQIIALF